ncbi:MULTISPECIES: NADPH-dependent F420 reductase [Rhizobium/Agrobacterium group]|uniref:NADPH-dependent F420 reductase n=1 Tax=Rhizobium/Agrobacterium group TaxID=227290 RepID=UPI000DCFA741|nr:MULTISPECIES: NAD(P)-binding domain-containing protein [Rhizobium/Agrobacterium group]NTA19559.1 NAD(P)-binding domain-containing protein [Agrobacterium tumefaciens]WCK74571.1 NAD(P)-binding domain-containing protein [Agrobacterium tumefaciens]
MKIGIIGAGMVGRAIGKLAVALGHSVMLSNSRGPQTLFSLSRSIGCQVGTVEEAAAFGELVVIAIPLAAYRSIPVEPLEGKLVIDTNNYYFERDGHIPELDSGETTTSEILARHLPRSRIVKAFNAIIMDDLEKDGQPTGSSGRRGLPLAGDNSTDKAVVARLYDQFGFDAVDAGLLAEGWRFERGRPVYCVPMAADRLNDELAKTIR